VQLLSVKHKGHLDSIWRPNPEHTSRHGLLRLDKNERLSLFPSDVWQDCINALTQESVLSYPEVGPLYRRLAQHHQVSEDSLLLTAGSDAAIRHCFEAFVNPGDRVLYPCPTFAMVTVYGELFAADMRGIGYDRALILDIKTLTEQIDNNTALIVLANPNSPTGGCVERNSLVRMIETARLNRVPVLVDEAYFGFTEESALDLVQRFDNLIVSRTMSKVAGIAGLRLGYVVGQPLIIHMLSRFRPMYEVNSASIVFTKVLLDHWDAVADYGRRTIDGRNKLANYLAETGFSVVNTQANFLHVEFGEQTEEILLDFASAGVLVKGGLDVPGYESYTRLSVGPWECLAPLVTIIERHGKNR